MQPFPKIGLFFAEFGYFLSEFGCSSFYLVTLLQSASIGHVHETSSRYIDLTWQGQQWLTIAFNRSHHAEQT